MDIGKESLKKTGACIKRLIHLSGLSMVDIARQINVDRLTIYNWINAKSTVSEENLESLAKLFNLDPCEVRYDVSLLSKDDLTVVLGMVERELAEHGLVVSAEKKADITVALYHLYQQQKRFLHTEFVAASFKETSVDFIRLLATSEKI
jgi:transcriptional regulator with XRE-family HTH domain